MSLDKEIRDAVMFLAKQKKLELMKKEISDLQKSIEEQQQVCTPEELERLKKYFQKGD